MKTRMLKRVETACTGRGSVLVGMMALLIATCGVVARGGDLASGFQTPPADCRPDVWWRFFGDEITEEGAVQDVRELAAAGAGHAQMFHLAGAPEGTVAFLSPQWWKVMETAGKEAARQGMHISPQHMSGWSSGGGPWITPDRSMQKLVWTVKSVSGQGAVTLLQPETVLKYYRDVAVLAYPVEEAIGADMAVRPTVTMVSGKAEGELSLLVDGRPETQVKLNPEAGKTDIILELTYERPITVRSLWIDPAIEGSYMAGTLHGYGGEIQAETAPGQFKTIGSIASACTVLPATSAARFRIRVQAPPVLINNRINEIDLSPVSRLHQFEIKSAMVAKMAMQAQPPTADSSVVVDPAKIVDLTGKMSADGKLAWDVPPGRWVVLRIGQTSSDRMGRVSTKDGLGLESDKLDADATRLHFDSYSGKFITRINQESPGVVNEVFMDSWESGSQNWTAKMPEEFLRRRGYDLKPYLPALTGLIVGNVEQTERFLWDLRRTVADLIADNFYGVMREKSNGLGAQLVAEASGPFHGLNPVVDALQAKGRTDIPMGEFLNPAGVFEEYDPKEAASAAHIYGKSTVSAEDFSWFNDNDPHGGGQFNSPRELLHLEHLAFCQGVNRNTLTTFVHQAKRATAPVKDPGWGPVLNSPWWSLARGYTDYLTRCQYLLRQGHFVADICYFYGEGTPNGLHHIYAPDLQGHQKELKVPRFPAGYDYDECNAEVLLTRMSVKKGRLVLPDGMSYRILVLSDQRTMTPAVLEKIARFVKGGATVVGPKPLQSPSLAGQPQADERVRTLADQVWGDCDGTNVTEHSYGKGRVVWGRPVDQVLASVNTGPDFASADESKTPFLYIHRRTAKRDIYFVFNRSGEWATRSCTFRVANAAPELWDAVTGRRSPVASKSAALGAEVSLTLPPFGATFVVFDAARRAPAGQAPAPVKFSEVLELKGPWTVDFAPMASCDKPFTLTMERLTPWNLHADRNVRYFAGRATYRGSFIVDAPMLKLPLRLDLGPALGDVAEVKVNGKPAGSLWMPPYQVDVSGLLKSGENQLEIVVANRWINRLLGELQADPLPPAMQRNPFKKKETPLVEAGLIGPVKLSAGER